MDSHTWLEIGTGYWLGGQVELAAGPQFSFRWASLMVAHAFSCMVDGFLEVSQNNKAQCARTYQPFACITLANVPLAQTSNMAKPKISM